MGLYREAYAGTAANNTFPNMPAQHAGLLHPPKAQGRVTVARILPEPVGWIEQCWEPWKLEAVLASAEGQPDTYLSQNRFRVNHRAVANILKLCCLFSDLDYYNMAELRDLRPEEVLERVLEWLRERGVPEPSLALCSGRGLTLVWRHTLVPRTRLPDWNAAQDLIYRVLKPFGADPKSRDGARVLRIAGTTNSKNGAAVRALGEASERVYRFEDLVEALVKDPIQADEEDHKNPGADLYSLAVQRAVRGLCNHPQGWNEISLWEGRLTDLQHLRRMRYGEGPMEDFRDRWLFIATNAISWLVVPEVLEREALALAEEAGGWDERRTRSDLSQVFKRATMAARGEKVEFMGREWDPRHHFRNETIIEWLEITPEEEREMVVTVSAMEESRRKRDRDRDYQDKRRRAKGVPTRAEHNKCTNAALRKRIAAASQLKKCGASTAQIAARMGVSQRTVQRWPL
jgi:hypothetical protein